MSRALWLCPLLAASASAVAAGGFLTSHPRVVSFPWTPPTRSFRAAVDEAYPGGHRPARFREARQGVRPTTKAFVRWVERELLGGPDPFAAHGGEVPLPWPEGEEYDDDQLGKGHYLAYSRRQLCFIVAKSFTGADTRGYANGLRRFFEQRAQGGCLPRTGDFGRGLIVFLETCCADPTLAFGGQGPLVIVAKASPPPDMGEVRQAAREAPLAGAGLRVCQYGDGAAPLGEGVARVPPEGCAGPSEQGPGRDFMTGGLAGQAVQDISAAFLGGYVFGNACGLGGGQDERLMTYMPEVAALTFFLSQHPQHPQLRQPAWILGARMLFWGLDGTARFNNQLVVREDAPLTSDLREVQLGGATYWTSGSRPFVAFQTENQGFFSWERRFTDTPLARRNKLASQREVSPSSWYAFEKQVRAWYRSVALSSYHEAVRPMLRAMVSSIGTGPWLAGLWWGDSQLGFLAVWLGHALAARTWRGEGAAALPVDFYTYSAFTESPGSQCLVHASDRCLACLERCNANPLTRRSFWMPAEAYFDGHSCVPANADDCGRNGLEEVVVAYTGKTVADLWTHVEAKLAAAGGSTESSVFDLVLGAGPAQPQTLLP